MSIDFEADLAAAFNTNDACVDAVWKAGGAGADTPVVVRFVDAVQRDSFGEAGLTGASYWLRVPKHVLPNLDKNDTFTIASVVFTVVRKLTDGTGGVWLAGLDPPA